MAALAMLLPETWMPICDAAQGGAADLDGVGEAHLAPEVQRGHHHPPARHSRWRYTSCVAQPGGPLAA